MVDNALADDDARTTIVGVALGRFLSDAKVGGSHDASAATLWTFIEAERSLAVAE